MKFVTVITISYEADETEYPGGLTEEDIRNEVGIWRDSVKRLIDDEAVVGFIEDITVEEYKGVKAT